MSHNYTLQKFWRYNNVPLENFVDHNRDSLGEFARVIHLINLIEVRVFHLNAELTYFAL